VVLSGMNAGTHNLLETPSYITSLRSYRLVWRFVLIIAILQTFYAIGFIIRTSFVVEGQRYFCLFDDAMISMRYAANWAEGHGLVWNPGERVEGYTNFAWTVIMGLCHLLRLSPSNTCLVVQLLGIPILWSCLVGTLVLSRACRLLPATACCAAVLTGTLYVLIFFTLFGMEVGLLASLVTFALAQSVNVLRKREGRMSVFLWFVPAILIRMDVLPIILFVFIFLCIFVRRGRLRLLAGLMIIALVLLIHFLWRYHFYGQWLPNTYYLKLTGWPLVDRIAAGIRHSFWTAAMFGLPALLAVVVLLIRPKRWHFLLFSIFAISVAYQVYIGGDFCRLNRFVLPAVPGLLVLAAEGIHRITRLLMKHKQASLGIAFRVVLTGLCIIAINALHWGHLLLITRAPMTGANRMNIRYLYAVEKVADPNDSVAVRWAGTFPYFSRRFCADILGKCDPYIAHLPADTTVAVAGHNKRDLKYTITTYKPGIILHMLDTTVLELCLEYRPIAVEVDGTEVAFCVRKGISGIKGSRAISWAQCEEMLIKTKQELEENF
jgi:arabinofuranosyltransferase